VKLSTFFVLKPVPKTTWIPLKVDVRFVPVTDVTPLEYRDCLICAPAWRNGRACALAQTYRRSVRASSEDAGLLVLPNAPFNRLNPYRRAQVGVNPFAGICLSAREFKRYDFLCFDNTQLKVLVEWRR
jgi:hypothetical protein